MIVTALVIATVVASGGCGATIVDGGLVAPSPPPGHAHPSPVPPSPARAWSNPAGWPGGTTPAAGSVVTIPSGDAVLLDVTPPPLGGLVIDGALVFDDQDLELTSDWIMVHGGMYIGSEAKPFERRAMITLTGAPSGRDVIGMGEKVFGVMDGVVAFHGYAPGPSWTRLVDHAKPGDGAITVEDATGWQVGDRIVLASTDFEAWSGPQGDPRSRDAQVEERSIVAVDGTTLWLDVPLHYAHVGRKEDVHGVRVDQRAEVARLTRSIVIQGDADSADPASGHFGFGGHLMAMGASRVQLHGVELRRMGQRGLLGRYPVHWHLMGDLGAESAVTGSTVHESFNRCLTIHGTNSVRIEDVVAYDATGHCFFLEDGAETGNVIARSLALMVRRPAAEHALLPSDTHPLGPAGFWITNPDNVIVDNVAASSQGTGFWYALPEHPTGPSFDLFGGANVFPRRTPLGEFRGNVAHSNGASGLHVDDGPSHDLERLESEMYQPRAVPSDLASAPVVATFEDFSAYKNRINGAWLRGDHGVLRGGVLSDNAVGVTFASRDSGAVNVAFVGETSNIGSPRPWEPTGEDGRALPRPWHPEFAIRGFEFYDGAVWVRDSDFAGFDSNGLRPAAGLGYLEFTAFPVSPRNAVSGLRFASGTNRVFLESHVGTPLDAADGYRTAVIRDDDGSLTGSAGSYVVAETPLVRVDDCVPREQWNAWVCTGRYVALILVDVDGSVGLSPVTVTRSDGTSHEMLGVPEDHLYFRSVVRTEFSYRYAFDGTSDHLRVWLEDATAGDAMVVSLPWSGDAPFLYRDWWIDDRSLLLGFDHYSALEHATDAGYFHDGVTLYLKLVVQDERDYAQVEICRFRGCP